MLAEPPFPLGVGGELGGELGGGGTQGRGQRPVLAAHLPTVVLHPALILPPGEEGGQLFIDGREKLGEFLAPVGEIARKILPLSPAPIHHGGEGVVEGVIGAYIVPLPAHQLHGAGAAHLGGGAVEDGGGVVVVAHRSAARSPQGRVEGAKGGGGGFQPFLHMAHGFFSGVLPVLLDQ